MNIDNVRLEKVVQGDIVARTYRPLSQFVTHAVGSEFVINDLVPTEWAVGRRPDEVPGIMMKTFAIDWGTGYKTVVFRLQTSNREGEDGEFPVVTLYEGAHSRSPLAKIPEDLLVFEAESAELLHGQDSGRIEGEGWTSRPGADRAGFAIFAQPSGRWGRTHKRAVFRMLSDEDPASPGSQLAVGINILSWISSCRILLVSSSPGFFGGVIVGGPIRTRGRNQSL